MIDEHFERSEENDGFNMLSWRFSIPLCDDLWLGMQAQNIYIVDRIVRFFEQQALQEFYEKDKFTMETLMPLSAMSQVWVFALYEFLRTWLQRASKLLGYADRLKSCKTDDERAALMKKFVAEAAERAKHIKLAPYFYDGHVGMVGDEQFIASVRAYKEEIKYLFRDAEAIRIPLAKHEIAGTKGQKFMAEAPGYGRVDTFSGSMYWQINLPDGAVDVIRRHSLADRFFRTETPKEPSALMADCDFEEPPPPESEMTSSEDFFDEPSDAESTRRRKAVPRDKQQRRRAKQRARRGKSGKAAKT